MAARKKVIDVPRFKIANDGSHDFAIPVDKEEEFYKWAYDDLTDGGPEPSYATRIDGRFTFTDPKCE